MAIDIDAFLESEVVASFLEREPPLFAESQGSLAQRHLTAFCQGAATDWFSVGSVHFTLEPLSGGEFPGVLIRRKRHDRWVYVLTSGSGGVKIGSTTRTTKERMAELQRATADRLAIWCTLWADERTERRVHELVAEFRVRGEWFRRDCLEVLERELWDVPGMDYFDLLAWRDADEVLRAGLREAHRIAREARQQRVAAAENRHGHGWSS